MKCVIITRSRNVWIKVIAFINDVSEKRVFVFSSRKYIESIWFSVRVFHFSFDG